MTNDSNQPDSTDNSPFRLSTTDGEVFGVWIPPKGGSDKETPSEALARLYAKSSFFDLIENAQAISYGLGKARAEGNDKLFAEYAVTLQEIAHQLTLNISDSILENQCAMLSNGYEMRALIAEHRSTKKAQ